MTAVNAEPSAINVTADTTKGIINGTADINDRRRESSAR